MKLSTFTIVKNEAEYIGYHIMSLLDHVDEMVFFDGNSTDGTIEIIEYIQKKYDKEKKIRLFKNKDCKDLKEDYTRLFNDCLHQCTGDYVWFIHPDQIVTNPEIIRREIDGSNIRYSFKIVSIAGENRDKVIYAGRGSRWHTIYKNDLGLHYYGYYGAAEEDCYFSAITGDEHVMYWQYAYKPYPIKDTNINVLHYCDCKPHARRLDRMKKILSLTNYKDEQFAINHPRVTLQDGLFNGVLHRFIPNTWDPEVFKRYKKEFKRRVKGA